MKGLEFVSEAILRHPQPEAVEENPKWAAAVVKKSLILLSDILGSDKKISEEAPHQC